VHRAALEGSVAAKRRLSPTRLEVEGSSPLSAGFQRTYRLRLNLTLRAAARSVADGTRERGPEHTVGLDPEELGDRSAEIPERLACAQVERTPT
jgi:hypothetical protein